MDAMTDGEDESARWGSRSTSLAPSNRRRARPASRTNYFWPIFKVPSGAFSLISARLLISPSGYFSR